MFFDRYEHFPILNFVKFNENQVLQLITNKTKTKRNTHGTRDFRECSKQSKMIPIFTKIIFVKDVSICFLYCLNYFGNKYGVRGSIFGHMFGRSKNVLKTIAIDQESFISPFGRSKTL